MNINDLTQIDAAADDDKLAIYSKANGATRGITIANIRAAIASLGTSVMNLLAQPGGANLVGYGSSTVGDELNATRAVLDTLPTPSGAAEIGYGTRTVADKLGERVSIKDAPYSATGDGVADDYLAIIAARDHCVATGAELVLPGGPNSIYAHSSTINFGFAKLRVCFEGGAKLKHTGTGVAVSLDAGATAQVFDIHLKHPRIEGNANTTDALWVRGCHHLKVPDLNARNFTGAALRTNWCVDSEFPNVACSVNQGAFTVTPTAGIVIDRRGAGEYSVGVKLDNPKIEGINGIGLDIVSGSSNIVSGGTFEANVIGARTQTGSNGNRLSGVWCEANTTGDAVISGNGNVLDTVTMQSPCSNYNAEIVSGDGNLIIGGAVRSINKQAASTNTGVIGTRVSDDASLGLRGSGTGYNIGVRKVDTSGNLTGVVPDKIGEPGGTFVPAFSSAGGGTQGTATAATGTCTRVGGAALVQVTLAAPKATLGAGEVSITGFPYVTRSDANCFQYLECGEWDNISLGAGYTKISLRFLNGSSVGTLIKSGSGVPDALVNVADFPDPMNLRLSGSLQIQ